MKKNQRKENNKKKTKDICTVLQTPTLLTTMKLSSASAEQLVGKLESLDQSTPSQTRATKGDLCKEEDLCKGMDDLAFSDLVKVAAELCKGIDDLAFSGPGNHLNKDDYHAWCIDDEGVVCDYMTQHLAKNSNYGTGDIICRPFTAHLISQWIDQCDKIYDAFLQSIAAEWGEGDVEATKTALLGIINTPFFPSKNCYIPAKLLQESNPQNIHLLLVRWDLDRQMVEYIGSMVNVLI
jgi:hypothetical protein